MILEKEYFRASAVELAPKLLGKLLCKEDENGRIRKVRIVEVECYFGEEDTACHAHKGKTPRTQTLYLEGGVTYVYLCYGMHALLNFVTGDEGHPEAVLIRGVDGAIGPGRLTKLLGITRADNALPLSVESGIWVEDDGFVPKKIEKTPRIGIDYASARDRNRKWRFLIKLS